MSRKRDAWKRNKETGGKILPVSSKSRTHGFEVLGLDHFNPIYFSYYSTLYSTPSWFFPRESCVLFARSESPAGIPPQFDWFKLREVTFYMIYNTQEARMRDCAVVGKLITNTRVNNSTSDAIFKEVRSEAAANKASIIDFVNFIQTFQPGLFWRCCQRAY